MKKKKYFLILIALTGLAGMLSCGEGKSNEKSANAGAAPTYPVLEVSRRTVTSFSSYPASIEGSVNSAVRAKVSGYITDVLVEEGEEVKKGQLLFKLETESLNQDAQAAKANVNAAQVEVDKLRPLVEKDIISEVQLETAKAKLEQAKSNYNSIAANIGYANIKSPVDGVVGKINYRKGALVSPQDQMPLTQVSSIEEVYAIFSMNEKDFLDFMSDAKGKTTSEKIKNTPKVSLIMANSREYENQGTIETISGNIDEQTGTVSFRAKFENNGLLRNGSSGTIKVPRTYEKAIVVPSLSTYERQGQTFVYKVQADTLNSSAIDILTEVKNLYVISEDDGVKEGDIILAKGTGKVRPGMKISPERTSLDSITGSFDQVFK
ncbi:efflux RND transporter periplasmic adaptor subunit [Pontixanthobacter gangjinensis]|uniref:Efflux RND transporter periplasmic adaptor subunit n=1 Tax=Christiangramia aestuarii TaxID=1028746 RepID=A0A7K1LSJ8_9FLAO|nr:efflux RND transporter periplasmic adaptor subunit [Christiangramia aestuarii]MUP43782.1 efflux RND transporter periplasmic adaptor subunit [Christiangramia aestuarii]